MQSTQILQVLQSAISRCIHHKHLSVTVGVGDSNCHVTAITYLNHTSKKIMYQLQLFNEFRSGKQCHCEPLTGNLMQIYDRSTFKLHSRP